MTIPMLQTSKGPARFQSIGADERFWIYSRLFSLKMEWVEPTIAAFVERRLSLIIKVVQPIRLAGCVP